MRVVNRTRILSTIKWVGRIIGFSASIFFLMFFIGEGVPDITKGIAADLVFFLFFITIAIAGYIIAIFKEKLGGVMEIIGGVFMSIFHLLNGGLQDLNMAIIYGAPFILSGLISIITRK